MTDVVTDIEYKIYRENKSFLLDKKKYQLLDDINKCNSISEAAKLSEISYRTALNFINKIESNLDIKIVDTFKGGKGGGGKTNLTKDGFSILKECKKLNAIMELHKDFNEVETSVIGIDKSKGVMELKNNGFAITVPSNSNYEVGDTVLALINYDNIFLMLEPQHSTIRNIIKGKILEMNLENNIIRVKIDIGGVNLFSYITVSAKKDLGFDLGDEVFVAFKAMSVATLKL